MKKTIATAFAAMACCFVLTAKAGDLSLLRSPDTLRTKGFVETDNQGKLFLEPKISVGDDVLKPSLNFSTSKLFTKYPNLKVIFEFTANAELKSDEATEMVNDYIFDGGNLEFNLGANYIVEEVPGLRFELAYKYSLITSEELSVQNNVTDIDSEVQSLNFKTQYIFNEFVTFKMDYRKYDARNNGAASEFNTLLDDDNALVFGLLMKFTSDNNPYLLKFERARSSNVGDSNFRIALETQF